jgi:paraquat-inducible protein B
MRRPAPNGQPTFFGKDYRDKDFRALSTSSSPRACAPSCATATWSPASSTWPSISSPAPAGKADWNASPPRLPTQRGSLDELQTTLLRIVGKLDKLPIDRSARHPQGHRQPAAHHRRAEALVKRIDNLTDGEVRDTVVEARSAIADTRKLLASDAPLQQDLRASLQELGRAAQALRHLADTLDRHPEALLRGKPEEKP